MGSGAAGGVAPRTRAADAGWHMAADLSTGIAATLSVMSGCATTGALVGLHALGSARRSLRAVIPTSVLIVAFSVVGALAGGTVGTMLYAAAASLLGALLTWWQFRKALHESGTYRAQMVVARPPGGTPSHVSAVIGVASVYLLQPGWLLYEWYVDELLLTRLT